MTFQKIFGELWAGFGKTLLIFAVTLVLSLPFGLIIAFGSRSKFKPLQFLCKGFVWIIRGTPLMLQILLVSLVPKYVFNVMTKNLSILLGIKMNTLLLIFVLIAFVINYACYFSEIFRGALDGIPKGQYEAGQVLGMKKNQIFRHIILFQVIKKTLAPVSNEVITLVKDTALAEVLGVLELFNSASHAVNQYAVLTPLLYAGIFYLLFNGILTVLFGMLEKKMSFYKE